MMDNNNYDVTETTNIKENKKTSFADIFLLLILITIMVIAIGIPLGLLAKGFNDTYAEMKEVKAEKILLASTVHDTRSEGKFRYGRGYIEDKDYFVAYQILDDGAKKIYKMEAQKTYIYNTLQPGEQAYVDVYKDGFGYIQKYHLYVPENAIEEEYNLSLE